MNNIFGVFGLLLLFFLFSCGNVANQRLYEVSDFVPDSIFTNGIEGPAVDKEGFIYAVNFSEQGTIGKISPEGKAGLFVTLPEESIGNGIRFNKNGNMFIADYKRHNILKVNIETKDLEVYAHDTVLNQPNDLAIADDGTLYASDPNWGNSTGRLWKVTNKGVFVLLEDSMGTTNGVEVSPENTKLYVNESIQKKVWVYNLSNNGEISNKQLFYQFNDFGMDGMRCDIEGNLYITRYGKGTVAVLSPKGKLIREITLKGKNVTNIAFGGPDGKTCYVTLADRGCLETFRVEVSGRSWTMWSD
ncbi:MAG: SMP-30/gluconolactonase/LRE family protein [Bacteroidota bacterium]